MATSHHTRAEHVGSFLRPDPVKKTRAAWRRGEVSPDELRKVEDAAIAELVEQQLSNGRTDYFHLDFIQHLEGVTIEGWLDLLNKRKEVTIPSVKVTGRLRHVKPIEADNFKFVAERLKASSNPHAKDAVVKCTIPSPTSVHFRGGRASIDIEAYPSLDLFFEDLAECWRQEIRALAEAGCTYLQLDDTNLAYLCDEKMRKAAAGRGEDLNTLPRQYAQLINSALRDRPKGMTVGIHLCRGNFRSNHFAEGGYEPIAEVLFRELDVDIYLLEFDTARAGTFEPLRFLDPSSHKVVVLGLVSSKVGKLEDEKEIVKRIEEAAKYADKRQLAVSPQCGFSSTAAGNEITEEDQWAKLRLVARIAHDVWG